MEQNIYKYILRHTKRDQLILLFLTLASMPLVYISLEIPKIIVNEAIGGQGVPESLLGFEMTQISYLMVLCFAFLFVVVASGVLKYVQNVYSGIVGERMLRRFRFELFSRILRFPLPHFKKTSPGEIIPMITAETEPLGGFIGDSFVLPAFQGGLLLTYLYFIFAQDLLLGLAAVALYPPQMILIPRLQRRVNQLAKERVRSVRSLADRVGDSVSGVGEIHANDTSRLERAEISYRLGHIFVIRFEIYKRKFFIKFLNNFLAQLTPFFFYSIGGYFVIRGELSLGALVAVLAAYKDISPPWKELLKYYEIKEDIRVKYAQIIDQFQPQGMLDEALLEEPSEIRPLSGALVGNRVSYSEDDKVFPLDGASFEFDAGDHVAVTGAAGSGRDELSRVLARLLFPTGGRLTIDDTPMTELPEPLVGRRIAYVGAGAHIFTGTIRHNLFMSLRHKPVREAEDDEQSRERKRRRMHDARVSGNSEDDFEADWIDYDAAGADGPDSLLERAIEVLRVVGFDDDVFQFGLNARLDPHRHPELAERIVAARSAVLESLRDPGMAKLVEFFNDDRFNNNISVAENILFGAPLVDAFRVENLAGNETVIEVLDTVGLSEELSRIGRQMAEAMVDIFADVPPDSELFDQFSFISFEDLATFRSVLSRTAARSHGEWGPEDHQTFCALAFRMVPARHRLGLIDESFQQRIVETRHLLRERLGAENDRVDFLDSATFNATITIQENILFGTLAYGQAHARERINAMLGQVIDREGLRPAIIAVGLDFETGSSGSRLSSLQRQRLAMARAMIKRPDILILNEAAGGLDPNSLRRLASDIIAHRTGKGLIWVLEDIALANLFDKVMVLDGGRVVQFGHYPDLHAEEQGTLRRLLAT